MSFNFFINVDQCLNMSNYDIFFYQLQDQRQFFVTNAIFDSELIKGNSFQDALYDVKNYLDQAPFPIFDYRIIFGMRQTYNYTTASDWKTSILYRLLKIYYGLQEAKIQVQLLNNQDTNVTIIMIYNVDESYTENNLPSENYDFTEEISIPLQYIGINLDDCSSEYELYCQIRKIIDDEELVSKLKKDDQITVQFFSDFCKWVEAHRLDEADEPFEGFRNSFKNEQMIENDITKLNNLKEFLNTCISSYCVFLKFVNGHNKYSEQLSLLGIVDYITTGLIPEEDGNSSLRRVAEKNWREAINEEKVLDKYGLMLRRYRTRLTEEKRKLEDLAGLEGDKYIPDNTTIEDINVRFNDEKYIDQIKEQFEGFIRRGFMSSSAEQEWEAVIKFLISQTDSMNEKLEEYAIHLSEKYKEALETRKKNRIRDEFQNIINSGIIYERNSMDSQIRILNNEREKILENLKLPKMNAAVKYQDQLNVETSIKQHDAQVRFLIRCRKMLKNGHFLLLFLICAGVPILHQLIFQESILSNANALLGVIASASLSVFLLLFSKSAPKHFLKSKLRQILSLLTSDIEVYTKGFSEKADNFQDYINAINKLDIINAQLRTLQALREKSIRQASLILWHKVRIAQHLDKCEYFQLIMETNKIDHTEVTNIKLILEKDEIHNPLYWPQYRND